MEPPIQFLTLPNGIVPEYFFYDTKFNSQKSEWDWAAGIAYFRPLPTAKSSLIHTVYV